ncbi:hypothetical protein [Streptomyces arenae]|nr:hypothetical protein [Streptomyces arenae]
MTTTDPDTGDHLVECPGYLRRSPTTPGSTDARGPLSPSRR